MDRQFASKIQCFSLNEKGFKRSIHSNTAFTLVEVMIAAVIFTMGFTGLFVTYSQTIRILDSVQQASRVDGVLQANVEFLRTRAWDSVTNVVVTSGGSATSQNTSNLVESVSATSSLSPICSHLVLLAGDPLKIGLRNATRDVQIVAAPADPGAMVQATVTIAWQKTNGQFLTNGMSTFITKGGLSASTLGARKY